MPAERPINISERKMPPHSMRRNDKKMHPDKNIRFDPKLPIVDLQDLDRNQETEIITGLDALEEPTAGELLFDLIPEEEEVEELDLTPEFSRDGVKNYLHDIGKIPLIDLQKQIEIAKEAKKGDLIARQTLIECNLR